MTLPAVRPSSSFGHRVVTRVARSALGIMVVRNVGSRVDPTLIRLTGGRLSSVAPFPAMLLTHNGAKSGVSRTSTVVYFTDASYWPMSSLPVIATIGRRSGNGPPVAAYSVDLDRISAISASSARI